ncbi:helix-turn-helix domain-containing protein [Salinicoccus siamensis]|uniref:helix-turn-helix domain-containing protein n=1 Tax=Salinicoccus siamensis TaxID=381830 RepID=UPI00361A3A29
MTQLHDNTESIKDKHLTKEERAQIEVLKKEKYSNRAIARRLRRAPQTINNEIHRGTVQQMRRQKQNGKTYDYAYYVYDPDHAQTRYEMQRLHCGRRPKWSLSDAFVDWADAQMLDHHWSPDAVVLRNRRICSLLS